MIRYEDRLNATEALSQNWNASKNKAFQGFLSEPENRYLPLKSFAMYANRGENVNAVHVYLNQQDKVNRSGSLHKFILTLCGLTS